MGRWMSRTEHHWFGQTHVQVIGSHVITTLPDGTKVTAAPNYTEADVEIAHKLGYGGDVEAMTREHDLTHAKLCHALGLDESPALRAAATGQDTEASGADERMVLAAQELVNLVRSGR